MAAAKKWVVWVMALKTRLMCRVAVRRRVDVGAPQHAKDT